VFIFNYTFLVHGNKSLRLSVYILFLPKLGGIVLLSYLSLLMSKSRAAFSLRSVLILWQKNKRSDFVLFPFFNRKINIHNRHTCVHVSVCVFSNFLFIVLTLRVGGVVHQVAL